jgi:hypothetical protein
MELVVAMCSSFQWVHMQSHEQTGLQLSTALTITGSKGCMAGGAMHQHVKSIISCI